MDTFEILYRSGMLSKQNINGTPPLTFTSDGSPLEDYTIYGAAGGVGERTKNLANVNTMLQGYYAFANGNYISSGSWICTQKTTCKSDTDYTFHFENQSRGYGIVWWDADGNYISSNSLFQIAKPVTFTARSPANAAIMSVQVAGKATTSDQIRKKDMVNFQLEESSIATEYEPYGYKIPVMCGGETTNIYIGDTPLGTEQTVTSNETGIEIPTVDGENVLTVGTTVQPSIVKIKAFKSTALNRATRYFQYLYDIAE